MLRGYQLGRRRPAHLLFGPNFNSWRKKLFLVDFSLFLVKFRSKTSKLHPQIVFPTKKPIAFCNIILLYIRLSYGFSSPGVTKSQNHPVTQLKKNLKYNIPNHRYTSISKPPFKFNFTQKFKMLLNFQPKFQILSIIN